MKPLSVVNVDTHTISKPALFLFQDTTLMLDLTPPTDFLTFFFFAHTHLFTRGKVVSRMQQPSCRQTGEVGDDCSNQACRSSCSKSNWALPQMQHNRKKKKKKRSTPR